MQAADIRSTLAQELKLPNGQVVKNRLLKSAMSETMGSADNRVTADFPRLYGRWADGGIGLSVTGNVMVDPGALGEPGNVVCEDERDLEGLTAWAQAGKRNGGLLYMQVNHPGRQVPRFLNKDAVAPSAVPFGKQLAGAMAVSRALTEDEILGLIQRFATTAKIAEKAGFDGVQLHAAHGYLVSQFLSPLTNQRTDDWGGSGENRRRFAVEIIRAMRAATSSDFGVAIKINSADFQRGGSTEEESLGAILALADEGLDFVEISGGTYEAPAMMSPRKSTQEREAYFLAFAETLRGKLDGPLAVTGGFRSGAAMAQAVNSGAVDMVGLARTLAIAPDFPNELLQRGDVRQDLPNLKTGIGMVDSMAMAELLWYERQLHRMGKGNDPQPRENPVKALALYALKAGPKALRRRRA